MLLSDLFEGRIHLDFDKLYGKAFKVVDNSGDPNLPGFSIVTPSNGSVWNDWKERPEFKKIVKQKLNDPNFLGDHKYQQIINAMQKLGEGIEEDATSIQQIVNSYLSSDIGKAYAKHDCKTVTRAFVKWAKQNNIPTKVLNLAPPHPNLIDQRPELKGRSGEGDGHIMPIVGDQAIDFTARQFPSVSNPYNQPLITPLSQIKQVYQKLGGYFTYAPDWYLNGKASYYIGTWESQPASIMNQDFGDELLSEGPVWDKIKKTAAAAGLAGAVGYGALSGQFTGKDEPARAPVEIDIPGGDLEQQKPAVKKEKEKLTPSTATNANKEMEKVVYVAAKKAGIQGKELAQFMAQVAHETLGFQRLVEVGDKKYFNRYDPKHSPKKASILGNTKAGDGLRYKGRGFIQITGRDNYRKAGKALGIDLENNPKWASDPKIAAKIAVWYWQNRVKPAVDDYTDTIGVTAKINPSMNGLGDRDMNFHHYLRLLKLE
jgi:predicted chitinase